MVGMGVFCYFLPVRELALEKEGGPLWVQVCQRLDTERLRRLRRMQAAEKKASCAGAGLLLQWALQRAAEIPGLNGMPEDSGKVEFAEISLDEILAGIRAPEETEYVYGDKGKPYFKEFPFYFNLSHSGSYVICALSGQETGADIQKKVPLKDSHIADRFFSENEKILLRECVTEEERQNLFYRLWTRKEAYGKLTGEGIGASIGKDFSDLGTSWKEEVYFGETDCLWGYKIACCARRLPDV